MEPHVAEELAKLRQRVAELEERENRRRLRAQTWTPAEKRYQHLTDVAPVGIFQADAKGRCVCVNRQWCEITGLAPEEALGTGWHRLLHPADRERLFALWRKSVRDREPLHFEFRFQRPDGKITWVLGQGIVESNAIGKASGYLGTITDVTEHYQAEDALKQANRLLEQERNMFVTGPVVVFKWRNLEGWPVEFVSSNVREVIGYSVDDLVSGRVPYAQLVPPEDIARVAEEVRSNSDGGAASFEHLPYRLIRKDGSAIWVADDTTILRDGSGQVTHYLGYIIDVSERLRIEEALRHAQKLDSLGVLAAGVAHDFNNFLTAILGNAIMVQNEVPSDSPLFPRLERIEWAAQHAAEAARQMLIFTGKAESETRRFGLDQLVDEMSHLLKASLSKKIRLTRHPADDLPPIQGDTSQIRQVGFMEVAQNLLDNAIKFMSGQPRPRVEVGSRRDGDETILFVRDNGDGIDPAYHDKIFELFERLDPRIPGTGVGLAQVRRIIELHRGRIWVESEGRGKGSTFCFTLPAEHRPAA